MNSNRIDQLIANTILNSLDTLPAVGKVEAKQVRVHGHLIADYARIKLGCMHDVVEATDNAVLDDAFSNLVEGLRDDDTFVDAHCAAPDHVEQLSRAPVQVRATCGVVEQDRSREEQRAALREFEWRDRRHGPGGAETGARRRARGGRGEGRSRRGGTRRSRGRSIMGCHSLPGARPAKHGWC